MLNTDSIKRKVSVAISNAPTTIDINRQVYIEDGIGARTILARRFLGDRGRNG